MTPMTPMTPLANATSVADRQRKNELETMVNLSNQLKREKENMVITAAYIIAGIPGNPDYPGTPQYYELKEKIDNGTATNTEIQAFWTLNNNVMAKAAGLGSGSVKTDFGALSNPDAAAQYNGNMSVTVNPNHPYYSDSQKATSTAAHEVIGHVSDDNKIPQTAEERVLQQNTNVGYLDSMKEKSGFFSGAMMEKHQNIINNSTLANKR